MALADQLADTPRRQTGTPCSVGALEDKLTGTEADALHAMLYSLGWSAAKIYQAVIAEGEWLSQQQINRHRSRVCRCFGPA